MVSTEPSIMELRDNVRHRGEQKKACEKMKIGGYLGQLALKAF